MVVLIETFYVPTDSKQFKIQENLFEFLKNDIFAKQNLSRAIEFDNTH